MRPCLQITATATMTVTTAFYRNTSDHSQKSMCSSPQQSACLPTVFAFLQELPELKPFLWKVSSLNSFRGKRCCISNFSLLLISWARCCLQVCSPCSLASLSLPLEQLWQAGSQKKEAMQSAHGSVLGCCSTLLAVPPGP